MSEDELLLERRAREKARLEEERASVLADSAEEDRVLREIERWEDALDESNGRARNPAVDAAAPGGEAVWRFDTGKLPRGAVLRGAVAQLEVGGVEPAQP